jgi:hypothetical protein
MSPAAGTCCSLAIRRASRLDVAETDFSFSVNINSDDLPLNDLANEFGIILPRRLPLQHNPGETEGNYRNILLDRQMLRRASADREGWKQSSSTAAIHWKLGWRRTIAQAGPIPGRRRRSSAGDLALAALGAEGRVLALGDVTFLTDPYNRVYDNARFIAHIADFLVGPARQYRLADFPYFFDDPVNLVYLGAPTLGSRAFTKVGQLQEELAAAGRDLKLGSALEAGHDTLYLGLYSQAGELAALLAERRRHPGD